MTSKGHALAREELIRALTAYSGITTDDGAGDGTTLEDSNLIGRNDFVTEKTILIMSGDAKDEDKGAKSFNNVIGEITLQGTGFSAQIKKGTIYRILNISTVEIDVANIDTKIGTNTDAAGTTTVFARLRQIVDTYLASGTIGLAALKTLIDAAEAKLDKLAGETPVSGTVTANWNTETGTSTEPGEDLVTIGANDTKYKLHSFLINISALTVGAVITVKLFMQVHGTERKVYSQDFTVGTDTDGLWIVNGTVGIHEALRCEVYSDTNESKAIDYDYMLEAM